MLSNLNSAIRILKTIADFVSNIRAIVAGMAIITLGILFFLGVGSVGFSDITDVATGKKSFSDLKNIENYDPIYSCNGTSLEVSGTVIKINEEFGYYVVARENNQNLGDPVCVLNSSGVYQLVNTEELDQRHKNFVTHFTISFNKDLMLNQGDRVYVASIE